MEITAITPLRQEGTGVRRFEIELNDGALVFVDSSELLKYRRVQEAILRETGGVYSYEPAEKRGAIAAWQTYVTGLLQSEITVPEKESGTGSLRGYELRVYSVEKWRREHRDEAAA
jgi:hypothetical protein